MGRKRNPLGKDRNRTIQLDGDVAEKAQSLADEGKLSRKISELLRYHYQIDSEASRLKSQLNDLIDKRKEMQALEEELIEKINNAESEILHRRTNDLPGLLLKKDQILELMSKTNQQMSVAIPVEQTRLRKVYATQGELLNKVQTQIKELTE